MIWWEGDAALAPHHVFMPWIKPKSIGSNIMQSTNRVARSWSYFGLGPKLGDLKVGREFY